MKDAQLGQYLLWDDKPAKVVAWTDRRQVTIELLEDKTCPHCGGGLGKEQINVIVSSPMFQERANPMPTIMSDPTLIVS